MNYENELFIVLDDNPDFKLTYNRIFDNSPFEAVYNDDNRIEPYQLINALKSEIFLNDTNSETQSEKVLENRTGIVGLFNKDKISKNAEEEFIITPDRKQLCESERFFDQPVGPFGSGFLVTQDIIATAGHCILDKNIKNIYFVFGFEYKEKEDIDLKINKNDIYKAKNIIRYI
jgi:hypothetical protein